MNYKDIENLKLLLSKAVRDGYKIKNANFKLEGRVVGIGFKPLWTSPADSKIDKIELNIMDGNGRIIPFYLYNVIGCEITSRSDSDCSEKENLNLDIHIFAPNKSREDKPYNTLPIQLFI